MNEVRHETNVRNKTVQKSIWNGAFVIEIADPLPGDNTSPEFCDQTVLVLAGSIRLAMLASMALLNSESIKSDPAISKLFTSQQRHVHELAEKAHNHLPDEAWQSSIQFLELLHDDERWWTDLIFRPNIYLDIQDLSQKILACKYIFLGSPVNIK